jgi:aminomethyltransferase
MLRTPLHQTHIDNGGKMVDFAGWDMPLTYAWKSGGGGITDEHHQTRNSGGMFDVSHMGRVKVTGRHARKFLERVCTRRITDMKPGQCRYGLVLNEQGGIKDDVIVYRMDEDDFLVVVNASNRAKLLEHFAQIVQRESLTVNIDDQTIKTAMVAIQGPKVMAFISNFSKEVPSLKRYWFAVKNLLVMKLIVSRTGYTGEDGVEVILPAGMVGMALKLIMKDVDPSKPDALIKPCGLGARDTLRLEAGMPLYGHELSETTNALATGLDFAISLDKHTHERGEKFIGQDALLQTRDQGGTIEKLVGLVIEGKRAARQGMKVVVNDNPVGVVTSGAPSPTLGKPIAMAYVPAASTAEGTRFQIDTGKGDRLEAQVVKLPFYKAAPAK